MCFKKADSSYNDQLHGKSDYIQEMFTTCTDSVTYLIFIHITFPNLTMSNFNAALTKVCLNIGIWLVLLLSWHNYYETMHSAGNKTTSGPPLALKIISPPLFAKLKKFSPFVSHLSQTF